MEGRHSGVEEYSVQIIKNMVAIARHDKQEEHEWHLFYNSARRVHIPDMGPGVQLHAWRWPNKIFNILQYLLGWPRWDELLTRRIGVRPDVFFVPNARLLPLKECVPVVVTAHDLSYELFPEFYSKRRRLWHKLMRTKELMRDADHVIAVSRATESDLLRLYGLDKEKVSVIYSGVTQGFGRDSYNVKKSGKNKRNSFLPENFVLYLGTLEPRKNIVSIVQAWAAIADRVPHHLVIAGEKGWLSGELKGVVRKSHAREKIHLLGFVEEGDKGELYDKADLFIYPSFYEGFGFPPLESLLVGTPVIASHNSSLPEIVGEWATMVNPYDVGELSLVMEELLTNPSLVNVETKRAIRDRFSWDKAAQRTFDILNKVN